MRIAILAHSTNPRGGVVHALALGDALTGLGLSASVHAPDATGRGFFRPTLCETVPVPASRLGTVRDTHALVEARVADYLRHFENPANRGFDVFHAQDGLSGLALAILKRRGLIEGFARTVHHLDSFDDPRLAAIQARGIVEADRHFVVSPLWRTRLEADFGIDAVVVGNGVDRRRFSPRRGRNDDPLRRRLGLGGGPVFLAIGGIEARKNTLGILDAFVEVRASRPDAQLVIAGGVSLLDHGAYQARFAARLAASRLPPEAVLCIGAVPDADMPALYRNADALVFPSLKEGFGLVVLEAMASGLPVVVSAITPFTGFLGPDDAAWCVPEDAASIARAMVLALGRRAALAERGADVAARHDWRDTARAHLGAYAALGVPVHA